MRRAFAIVAALAIPRIALADWRTTEDPDCRCELALPDKPVMSTRPSPWPKLPWHRSEVRVSPTEWYAVSYIVFDKAPPPKALDTALAGLHGTIGSRTPSPSQLDARVKLGDGTTIAVQLVVHERRIYAVEAGDVGNGVTPDKLFAGFHAWTAKDAPPEGTVAGVTGGDLDGGDGGGLGVIGGGTGSAGSAPAHGAPDLKLGHVDVQNGSMQAEVVRRVLVHGRDKLLACYKRRLAKISSLAGDVHVRFTIEATGKTSHIDPNGLDEAVDSCLAGLLGALAFPTSSDGKPTTVLTIFTFETSP